VHAKKNFLHPGQQANLVLVKNGTNDKRKTPEIKKFWIEQKRIK
jgi:hypothetical protein